MGLLAEANWQAKWIAQPHDSAQHHGEKTFQAPAIQCVIFNAKAMSHGFLSGKVRCNPFSSRTNFNLPRIPSICTLPILLGHCGEFSASDWMVTLPSAGNARKTAYSVLPSLDRVKRMSSGVNGFLCVSLWPSNWPFSKDLVDGPSPNT